MLFRSVVVIRLKMVVMIRLSLVVIRLRLVVMTSVKTGSSPILSFGGSGGQGTI